MRDHLWYIPPEPEKQWNIRGKRLAIVGYSHYHNGADDPDFTVKLVQSLCNGSWGHPFFTKIAGYFDLNGQDFFSHAAFLNFVPILIGSRLEMRKIAEEPLHARARSRIQRFIAQTNVERIIVLSTKAWNNFALSDEETKGERCKALFDTSRKFPLRAEVGTYTAGPRKILALGLPHPERSSKVLMREAIDAFLPPT